MITSSLTKSVPEYPAPPNLPLGGKGVEPPIPSYIARTFNTSATPSDISFLS